MLLTSKNNFVTLEVRAGTPYLDRFGQPRSFDLYSIKEVNHA